MALRQVTGDDVDRMTARVYLAGDGATASAARSAFWALLVLSAVIAGAGVVADSTATVIGAMIVAPLMTPILGTTVGLVLADRRQVVVGALLVVAGMATVVVIGFALGLMVDEPIVAATNSQVAGRVSPRLIDLVAALATGAVGAFALVRPDVSDTLPGVAIAISLVPPLSVVGLTLESGAPGQAFGALVLFGTNVAAILATGIIVLLVYRVREAAADSGRPVGRLTGGTLITVGAFVVLMAVPLTYGSLQVIEQQNVTSRARPVAAQWAGEAGWEVTGLTFGQNTLSVTATGSPPAPRDTALRQALDAAGLGDVDLEVSSVIGGTGELAGSR